MCSLCTTEMNYFAIFCPQYDKDDSVVYVKVHAPWSVLTAQAEMMNMKMPLAVSTCSFITSWAQCTTDSHFLSAAAVTVTGLPIQH